MNTTSVARPTERKNGHWYYTDGRPCYELAKKDGTGMKSPTLADARKLNLLPGVTTILDLLRKPALEAWKIEQGVLAVMTSKQNPGEELDAFINRVLQIERVQDQESQVARDRGTEIHDALESYFIGKEVPEEIKPWIMPAALAIAARGECVACEKILVGPGYAGRTDLIQEAPDAWLVADFKSTKKLPEKGAWFEHELQLAAYAKAWETTFMQAEGPTPKPIKTYNVYISTTEQGAFKIWDNDPDWPKAYRRGFVPLVIHWQYKNDYDPQQ